MLEKQKREFQSLEKQPLKTKAPKKNKENVECHHCGSTKYRRKGFDKGRPMYYCKDCSRHFILGANVLSNKDCIQLELACPECGNAQCWKAGKARDGRQRYKCKNCHRTFTKEPKQGKYDHNLPLSDDVWLASSLGVTVPEHRSLTKLVFIYIRQDWLKAIAKRFVRYMSKNRTFQTLTSYISELNCFSEFLDERYPSVNFNNINRYVIVDFIEYLNQKLTSSGAKSHYLSTLNVFFDVGTMNKWFDLPAGLILKEDFPKHRKPLPRYMPEEVIQKLNQHLDELPKPVMRMVLVIQECGLRVSELLHLPINCLRKSQKGDWYIQFMRGKTKKETTLPVSQQLAAVVGEQQEYIQDAFGKGNFDYLFCAKRQEPPGYHHRFRPQPKMMRDDSFTSYLKDLAEKFDICDSSGKRWNFQSHQFRHTVGTQMINNGVPQHIVQRYLGHESPEMTMVYAHIHDETLRKEIEKYHESRVVNFQGQAIKLEETILSSNDDLEWFKKNVQARALEHGYCARPKVLGDCDISGFDGCYNCPHWRTNKNFLPVLKDTLERTNNLLRKAQDCGWELQVHKNTPIKENLEKVIKSLEAGDD